MFCDIVICVGFDIRGSIDMYSGWQRLAQGIFSSPGFSDLNHISHDATSLFCPFMAVRDDIQNIVYFCLEEFASEQYVNCLGYSLGKWIHYVFFIKMPAMQHCFL